MPASSTGTLHVVELCLGSPFDMGRELPPPDLALSLTPNSLDPTLGIQCRAYWDEINPLLVKWRSVNDARCPEYVTPSLIIT